MDKYNAILNKLQHTAPIVTDPEGFDPTDYEGNRAACNP